MRKTAFLLVILLSMTLMGSALARPDLSSNDEAIIFESGGHEVDSILSGQSVNISIRVSNTGDEAANFTVAFYDGNPHDGGRLIGERYSHVNRSDYSVVTITWKTDDNARGDHDIWVIIDPENEVDEINEANNEYHRTIFLQIPGSMELGLHVMAVGLTVVLVSLTTLAIVLYIFAKVAERYDARHVAKATPKPSSGAAIHTMSEEEKAAVIAAAIEAYEEDTGGD